MIIHKTEKDNFIFNLYFFLNLFLNGNLFFINYISLIELLSSYRPISLNSSIGDVNLNLQLHYT